ncbi:PKD domain protein [compost metagenome]
MMKLWTTLLMVSSLAGCAVLTNTAPINLNKGAETKATAPVINSLSASPTNLTTGQPITFDVKASDPNGKSLEYRWNATGGVISANVGQSISWTPPSEPNTYPVQVTVTNSDGLTSSGTLNVIVKADGNVSVGAPSNEGE